MALKYGSRSPDGRWWWDGQAWQPVPEEQYAAERAGQLTGGPGGAWSAQPMQPGPLGRTRNPLTCILLAIVTLGIYTFVWVYKTQDEIKRHSDVGIGGGLGLLLYILVHVATYFLVAADVEVLYRRINRPSPVSVLTGFWLFLPLIGSIIWFVKVQRALNEYWMSLGAPPP